MWTFDKFTHIYINIVIYTHIYRFILIYLLVRILIYIHMYMVINLYLSSRQQFEGYTRTLLMTVMEEAMNLLDAAADQVCP
jgi:hypothetical protein